MIHHVSIPAREPQLQLLAHDGPSRTQIVTTDESKETWWTNSYLPRPRHLAIAIEDELCRSPDVDLGYHATKVYGRRR
jgi:hypothetical protein